MDFRHELKHEISYSDMLALRQRLNAVMKPDCHAVNGSYQIRSLYFDTPEDKALMEKLNGISRREKFRIRYYNGDTTKIRLEKKSKHNYLGSKESAPLTREEAYAISTGDHDWMLSSPHELIRELYAKITSQRLAPKTIVDYTREPFVYAPGNVRITIDYDIRTGLNCTDFLNSDCAMIPAGNSPIILEVKWDQFLPSVIRDIVQLPNRQTGSCSKYALCRMYG